MAEQPKPDECVCGGPSWDCCCGAAYRRLRPRNLYGRFDGLGNSLDPGASYPPLKRLGLSFGPGDLRRDAAPEIILRNGGATLIDRAARIDAVADVIFRELVRQGGRASLVQPPPARGVRTLLDGRFYLRSVARRVLAEIEAMDALTPTTEGGDHG